MINIIINSNLIYYIHVTFIQSLLFPFIGTVKPLNPFERAAKKSARVTLTQATAREARAATRGMTNRYATEPLTDDEEDTGTTTAVVEKSPDGSGEIYNIN